MILINPLKGSNTGEVIIDGASNHAINLKFANYLKEYIEDEGDKVTLTRTTDIYPTPSELSRLLVGIVPSVIINIDVFIDKTDTPKGYAVIANKATALVTTLNYEFYVAGRKPIYPLGYSITGKETKAMYNDVTLMLGFLSNPEDHSFLVDDEQLKDLAKRLIEGSYGPPIKLMEASDKLAISDPYFYKFDAWSESESIAGASGVIKKETLTSIPINTLHLINPASAKYTWEIPINYDSLVDSYILLAVKSQAVNSNLYVEHGPTDYTKPVTSADFTTFTFEVLAKPGYPLKVGLDGPGAIGITAVWFREKGSLGSLDDPRIAYSFFPPAFRPSTPIDFTNVSNSVIKQAITQATTLVQRAQDTAPQDKKEVDLSNAQISPASFTESLSGFSTFLNTVLADRVNVIDPLSIIVDYGALENSIKSMNNRQQKATTMRAVNSMKAMQNSLSAYQKTDDEKLAEAKGQAAAYSIIKEHEGSSL